MTMLERNQAVTAFLEYLDENGYVREPGYDMKRIHTLHVCERAMEIASSENCLQEDCDIAFLTALLHDIGRFPELAVLHMFDGTRFDHAEYGAKLLTDQGLLRRFLTDDRFDHIILKAIKNHNKLYIEENLDERELLHARLIRDADKLDNFRVKMEETPQEAYPGRGYTEEILAASRISDAVMEAVRACRCVKLAERKEPLDYYVCIMAFAFDLYFPYSCQYVLEHDFISRMKNRICCTDAETQKKLDEISQIISSYLRSRKTQ